MILIQRIPEKLLREHVWEHRNVFNFWIATIYRFLARNSTADASKSEFGEKPCLVMGYELIFIWYSRSGSSDGILKEQFFIQQISSIYIVNALWWLKLLVEFSGWKWWIHVINVVVRNDRSYVWVIVRADCSWNLLIFKCVVQSSLLVLTGKKKAYCSTFC